jgi:hypothetical protein
VRERQRSYTPVDDANEWSADNSRAQHEPVGQALPTSSVAVVATSASDAAARRRADSDDDEADTTDDEADRDDDESEREASATPMAPAPANV